MSNGTVLIAGASGVVGQAAARAFRDAGPWTIVGLSRRPPDDMDGVRHLPLDLTDAAACAQAIASLPPVTHLVYTALYEKADIVAGWRDPGQMAVNLAMLRNLVDPLCRSGTLAHVALLQGTKAYGVHRRPFPVPARESWPRDPHDNFYWLQEDFLKEAAARHGFGTTIFRPQVVFGDTTGVAMNLIPVLGIYAALRRAQGRPFSYPGGPAYVLEATDADLLGRALAWAATAPSARNETFNITNGDVFVWQNVWHALADALDIEPGEPEPLSLGDYLPTQEELWRTIVSRHDLAANSIAGLVGQSHRYADFCMASGATRQPAPVIVSTIKLRQAGFADCIDTEAMFRKHLVALREKRIIP